MSSDFNTRKAFADNKGADGGIGDPPDDKLRVGVVRIGPHRRFMNDGLFGADFGPPEHSSLLHIGPGVTVYGLKEGDVVRFDPFKEADMANPDTPTGMFVKSLLFGRYKSKKYFPDGIDGEDPPQEAITKQMQRNFVEDKGRRLWKQFKPEDEPVGARPKISGAPVGRKIFLSDSNAVTIEHEPGLKPIVVPVGKRDRELMVTFLNGEGHFVGDITIKVDNGHTLHKEDITLEPVAYARYSALERGALDIADDIVYQYVARQKEREVTGGDSISNARFEVLDFKAMAEYNIAQIDVLLEDAQRLGMNDEVAYFNAVRGILSDISGRIQYGDRQENVAALEDEFSQALSSLESPLEPSKTNIGDPAPGPK